MSKPGVTGGLQQNICIIGAGITGLTAAWQLARRGYKVRVLESTLQPGGMLSVFGIGNDRIEHIYHHLFTSDEDALTLLEEMGLIEKLCWHTVRDALFSDGQTVPFSSPLDLLRYKGIPVRQRLLTGLTVLKAGRLKDWTSLERTTACEWLISNCGQKAYNRLWKPLLQAKFDQDADEVSAVWIWNKFKLRGSSRSRNRQAERLGYLRGSFATLTDALIREIELLGGRICYGYTAMGLTRNDTESVNAYQIGRASCRERV